MRTAVTLLAWLVTAVITIVALARLTHLDDVIGWPFSSINAFTPELFLPAYGVVAVGFGLRRNLLMVLAVALVGLHLLWTVPEFWPGKAQPAPAGSVRLRLLSANLRFDNPDAGRLAAQISATRPDVITLVELSPLTRARLESSGALAGYPYKELFPRYGAFGSGIVSRYPLTNVGIETMATFPFLNATVAVDATHSFQVWAVHTISPTTHTLTSRWADEFAGLRARARTSRVPTVMAGDFNATRDHRPFRRLLDAGLRDTHDVVGAGWTPTWSATSVAPKLLRLDHVLVTRQFAVTGYRVGHAFGSDHLPVVADLALPATRAPTRPTA